MFQSDSWRLLWGSKLAQKKIFVQADERCATYLFRSTSFQSIKVPFSDQRDGCHSDRVFSVVKHPEQWLLRPERALRQKNWTEMQGIGHSHKTKAQFFVPKDLRMFLAFWSFCYTQTNSTMNQPQSRKAHLSPYVQHFPISTKLWCRCLNI